MVYNVAVSGLTALPKQFYQALAPQKANTTPYRLLLPLRAYRSEKVTDFCVSRIFALVTSTVLDVRSAVEASEISTLVRTPFSGDVLSVLTCANQAPILFLVRKSPSNWRVSRPSTLNLNMKLAYTSLWLVESESRSFVGSEPSVITMPWCLTSSDPAWRISSTSATASFPSRQYSYSLISSSPVSSTFMQNHSSIVTSSPTTS